MITRASVQERGIATTVTVDDWALREERFAVAKLFRDHGFTVELTTANASASIVAGFPDLRVAHPVRPISFFWQTTIRGLAEPLAPDVEFDEAHGEAWYSGDRHDAAELLVRYGFI